MMHHPLGSMMRARMSGRRCGTRHAGKWAAAPSRSPQQHRDAWL